MNPQNSVYLCGVVGTALLLSGLPCSSADEAPKVAATTTVRMSGRTVTFQRLEPPPKEQQPAAVSHIETQVFVDAMKPEYLSLSCTVYGGGLTEVRRQSVLGECRILSNVDFNFLRNAGPVTEGGHTWSIFMAVGRPTPPLNKGRNLPPCAGTASAF